MRFFYQQFFEVYVKGQYLSSLLSLNNLIPYLENSLIPYLENFMLSVYELIHLFPGDAGECQDVMATDLLGVSKLFRRVTYFRVSFRKPIKRDVSHKVRGVKSLF